MGRAEGGFQDGSLRVAVPSPSPTPRMATRRLSGRSIENKYLAISNKIYDMKTTSILNREYKKLPSLNFVIVLLATQVNRKMESDIEFSGRRDQVTAVCLLAK